MMFGLPTFRSPAVNPALDEALGGLYNPYELRLIEQYGTNIPIAAGSTFVHEGAPGREVVLILSGTAVVSRQGEEIAAVGQGDIIGEQAVLSGQPRNASLIATTDLVAVVFSVREFVSLLEVCPRLEAKVNLLVKQRQAA